MNKNLELLSYSKKFTVTKNKENEYKIEHIMITKNNIGEHF